MSHASWVVTGLCVVACGSGHQANTTTTVRDSLGVRIVESSAPAFTISPISIDSTPVVDLGSASGEPHEEFSGRVISVRLSDGRLVVANGASQELRVFDSQGTWQGSIGRGGAGPGEFRSLGWLDAGVGDTLRTYDWSLQRVQVFLPNGTFVRAYRLRAGGDEASAEPFGVLADGRVVAALQQAVGMSSRPGIHRDTVPLLAFDGMGRVSDTVGLFPGHEAWIQRTEHTVSVGGRPLGKSLHVATHEGHVVIGTADAPELLVAEADGRLIRIVRWAAEPAPVTAADKAAFLEREGAETGWEPGSEAMRDRQLAGLAEAPFPEAFPAYDGIVVGTDGSLWVKRFSRPSSEGNVYDLFDGDGAWLSVVALPARFTPTQITADEMIGVWTDPDDVKHVRVYRIRRV